MFVEVIGEKLVGGEGKGGGVAAPPSPILNRVKIFEFYFLLK